MGNDTLPTDFRHLRGVDTNTLLRMYDSAMREAQGTLQGHRKNLERCCNRIVRELGRRNEPIPRATVGQPAVVAPRKPR